VALESALAAAGAVNAGGAYACAYAAESKSFLLENSRSQSVSQSVLKRNARTRFFFHVFPASF